MVQRRNLVVVRCGDRSLHRDWISPGRNWDLAVSYFGNDAAAKFAEAEIIHRCRGGKWDGLHDFFAANPNVLHHYEYVWLPDDDIAADGRSISTLFDYMRDMKFELAQPSLSSVSFLSHLTCAWNPLFDYRNVNVVEIMVPVLEAKLLARVLPVFQLTKSGFGIDFVWHRFTSDPQTKVAIIDRVQVTHTRAVGGALKQMIAAEGKETAEQEEDRFLAPYGDIIRTEMVMAGRLRNGTRVEGRGLAASLAALGWAATPVGRRGFTSTLSPLRFLVWVARNWYGTVTERRRHIKAALSDPAGRVLSTLAVRDDAGSMVHECPDPPPWGNTREPI